MVHVLSFIPFLKPSRKAAELPVFIRQIATKNSHHINCLKVNQSGLLAAGNEDGVVAIFNLLSSVDGPQQVRLLGFEAGGVSELFWINNETLVVGTTRGWLVVYSMKNEASRFSELSHVKAHGDGVSHISVESIDYCPETQVLVSVGEGVGSIKLWNFLPDEGRLSSRAFLPETTAYQLPRFVSFTDRGSKIMVGYLQNALVQTFCLQPWTLVEEHILGNDNDANQRSHLGNASLLEASGQLVIFNLTRGLDIYDTSTFMRRFSGTHPIDEKCNQGLAILRGGAYVVSAARQGDIHIFRAHDASLALKLKVPGRGHQIDAIHASKCGSREFLVASSCIEGQPSLLTVWCHQEFNQIGSRQNAVSEHSTLRLVILCVVVSLASHFMASLSPLFRQDIWWRFGYDKPVHSLHQTAHSPHQALDLSSPHVMQDTSGSALNQQGLGLQNPSALTTNPPLNVVKKRHTSRKSKSSMEVIAL